MFVHIPGYDPHCAETSFVRRVSTAQKILNTLIDMHRCVIIESRAENRYSDTISAKAGYPVRLKHPRITAAVVTATGTCVYRHG